MSSYSLFSGECSVVVTTLYPTMQGSDTHLIFSLTNGGQRYESKAVPRRENRVHAPSRQQGFPRTVRHAQCFSPKDNFHAKFLKT